MSLHGVFLHNEKRNAAGFSPLRQAGINSAFNKLNDYLTLQPHSQIQSCSQQ